MVQIPEQLTPDVFVLIRVFLPGLSDDGCPARAAVVTALKSSGMHQLDTA